jgi:hypothetical protein
MSSQRFISPVLGQKFKQWQLKRQQIVSLQWPALVMEHIYIYKTVIIFILRNPFVTGEHPTDINWH